MLKFFENREAWLSFLYIFMALRAFLPHKETLYTSNIYPTRRFHKAVGLKKV